MAQFNLPTLKYSSYINDYGTFFRPTEESVFMAMTLMIAERSTCLRKHVATIFVDKKMRSVICFGYNGNAAGEKNQCDSLEPGHCGCIHSEMNAMAKNNSNLEGAICFVSMSPCPMCTKLLINSGISRLIYYEEYRNPQGLQSLRDHGIIVQKFDELADHANESITRDDPH